MYDVVVDVAKYREFVPWCIRSDIVKPVYPNMFKARMEIGFQVVKEQYMALVTHQKPVLVKV
jgi:coenzyme Q-binding protein COQ10